MIVKPKGTKIEDRDTTEKNPRTAISIFAFKGSTINAYGSAIIATAKSAKDIIRQSTQ